jgi:hypothetical protein
MERKDVMAKNVAIYKGQAAAIEAHASKDCKIVVVANPANTNALVLKEHAPSIKPENITCLTRLDHNRALGQVQGVGGGGGGGGGMCLASTCTPLGILKQRLLRYSPEVRSWDTICFSFRLEHLIAAVHTFTCALLLPTHPPMQLSEKCGVHVGKVKNAIIWGNHSSTQYPDVNHATVDGRPAREAVGDDAYLDGDFIETVQQVGGALCLCI